MSRTIPVYGFLAGLLLLVWFVYSPGFTSGLQFDDRPNLESLAHADSTLDILSFTLDGQAGPLGRPAALITFALQRDHWPSNLVPLFQTNVMLHLLTGVAVFWLALGLAKASANRQAHWIALLTSALWLFSPFLASSQLILIQRMTTLAGLFVFTGLAVYIWGRWLHVHRPRTGLIMMASGIIVGTLLAAFSKENGALLPLLALATEVTLLRRYLPVKSRMVRWLQWLIIGLPVALLMIYVAMRLPGIFSSTGHREFTPMQRVASQPGILWEYIRHLLIPSTISVTPFSDDRQAVSGWQDITVLLSTGAWFALATLAFVLRHRAPLLAFAVLFFLAGHLLESGIIYLELYYAHRNYIPAFGLYFALAVGLAHVVRYKPRLVILGSASYVLAFVIILFSTTSLWGQPLIAAEIWGRQHPESNRANQFLANAYFRIGDTATAQWVLQNGSITDNSGSSVAQTLYTCEFEEPRQQLASKQALIAAEQIRTGRHNNAMGTVILSVVVRVLEGRCDALSHDDLLMLIDAVLANPVYQRSTSIQARMLNAQALIAQSLGDTYISINYVKKMYKLTRHVNHARFYSDLLAAEGYYDQAIDFLEEARKDSSWNPVKRWLRNQIINEQIARIQSGRIETTDSL